MCVQSANQLYILYIVCIFDSERKALILTRTKFLYKKMMVVKKEIGAPKLSYKMVISWSLNGKGQRLSTRSCILFLVLVSYQNRRIDEEIPDLVCGGIENENTRLVGPCECEFSIWNITFTSYNVITSTY